jgi:aspartyl aminopeptidase
MLDIKECFLIKNQGYNSRLVKSKLLTISILENKKPYKLSLAASNSAIASLDNLHPIDSTFCLS